MLVNKYLICIVALLCANSVAYGQFLKGDHEVSVAYGDRSGTELVGFFLQASNATDGGSYVETVATGTYFASYRYYVKNTLSLGVTVGQQSFSYAHYSEDYSSVTPQYTFNGKVTTVAAELKGIYPYLDNEYFQMYGLIGLGASFYTERANPASTYTTLRPRFFNSQWTPLGFRFGGALGCFVELGIGYKGLASAGVSYRIGNKPRHPVTYSAAARRYAEKRRRKRW